MVESNLLDAYQLLFKKFGPQNWWPGDTPFEVMVGAILTQNTNWRNVSKAIANLKEKSALSPSAIDSLNHDELAALIRPAGYYNIKAARLKNFVSSFVKEFAGDVQQLKQMPLSETREWLLSIKGVGLETADSILLYALDKPIFVVDAYTKRILVRHDLVSEEASYFELQEVFVDGLVEDTELFNEYHALIVRVGKEFCRKRPLCDECPLKGWNR